MSEIIAHVYAVGDDTVDEKGWNLQHASGRVTPGWEQNHQHAQECRPRKRLQVGVMGRACVTSHFLYSLRKAQSEVISGSEDGRGGMECMSREEEVRPTPLRKEEGGKGHRK